MECDMSEARHSQRQIFVRIVTVLLAACLVWPSGALADELAAPSRHLLGNGLDVTLYDATNLLGRTTTLHGGPVIRLDGVRYLSVTTDVSDPSIYNKGDGEFHPFDAATVLSALEAVTHPHLRLRLTVYLLPYPRTNVLVSSTSGMEIFLSPHVLDVHPEVAAYIVTHELGHAFHNAFVKDGSGAWNEFRRVRGIEDTSKYSELSPHPYRPKEIFAEDFRVLFGGVDAAWDGQIENPDLASPRVVGGLDEFFRGLGADPVATRGPIIATSYPNPFNPETEIRFTVPADVWVRGDDVSVRIYDVTGALVRDVYSGAAVDDEVRVVWDGRDGRGNAVASAHYFAQIRAGESSTTLKLVMLK